MYAEDSAFIVEHYPNEIMFVEHITGKEITLIHSGVFRDILDVHNMILNKEIEGPCLRTLVIELSDATTAYKIKHPPIHPKE